MKSRQQHRLIVGRWLIWPVFAAKNAPHLLVLGPTQSRKTSAVVLPNIMFWDGPVVACTTKVDLFQTAWKVREMMGPVWMMDQSRSPLPLPYQVRSLVPSPLDGCDQWDIAFDVTYEMLWAARTKSEGSEFWLSRGHAVLAPAFFAFGLAGLPLRLLLDELRSGASAMVEKILSASGAPHAGEALRMFAEVSHTDERHRSDAYATALASLRSYRGDRLVALDHPTPWSPAAFLQSKGTVFIVCPADDAISSAPTVTGWLTRLLATITVEAAANNGALPTPLLLALDEAANISPLSRLDAIASEKFSVGLRLVVSLQSMSQARQRWGEDGAKNLWDNLRTRCILNGVNDRDTLAMLETLGGDVWRRTPDGDGQYQKVPVLPAHDIAHLGKHEVLVFEPTGTRRMKSASWWKVFPLRRWHAIAENQVG
jgi:type IV secretory pathway TraG/TraD family ATPase VirD4